MKLTAMVQSMIQLMSRYETQVTTQHNKLVEVSKELKNYQLSKLQDMSVDQLIAENYIEPSTNWVYSQHLTTVFCFVPRRDENHFKSSYNKAVANVVPSSAELLHTSKDLSVYSVSLFKQSVMEFSNKMKQQNVTVKKYEYNPSNVNKFNQQFHNLLNSSEELRAKLMNTINVAWSEIFVIHVQISIIRMYVEALLQNGLNCNFKFLLIRAQTSKYAALDTHVFPKLGIVDPKNKKKNEEAEDLIKIPIKTTIKLTSST